MILLTGATGFVGKAILKRLMQQPKLMIRTYGRRVPVSLSVENVCAVSHVIGEISRTVDYTPAISDVDVVIHCAAQTHVMDKSVNNAANIYTDINIDGVLNLARHAAAAGVRRFIFVSSIKVNGESTAIGSAFKYTDNAMPEDPYGVSKAEAEDGLWQISKETGMEIVIIRPPLVYGPGVKANFSSMMRLVSKSLPLPLGAIKNKRSMVALDNLVDLIVTCVEHPKAANQIFLVSDDQDMSTTELLQKMAHAFEKKAKLIPIPMSWIKWVATLLGKKVVADKLCGSLQVDITHTKETLGWKPPVTMEQQLAKIAASMSSPRDV